MKKIALLLILGLISTNVYAQEDNENDEYELKGTEQFGYIVNKSGNKIEGIVKLANAKYPWNNQKRVKFIAKSDIDKTRKNQKLKNFDVDDIKEYTAYDGDQARHFELIKYTNVREGMNTATGGLSGTLKTFNNLTKSNQLAEVVVDGKIKVYKLYGYPTTFAAGNNQIKQMEEETERLKNLPSYIVSKNNGKLTELNLSEAKSVLSDCGYVTSKIKNREYSSLKDNGKEKKSGLGKLIKKEVDNAKANVPAIIEEVFTDYNQNCSK
jgi:hypothetical protein